MNPKTNFIFLIWDHLPLCRTDGCLPDHNEVCHAPFARYKCQHWWRIRFSCLLTSLHQKKCLGFQAGKCTGTKAWHCSWKLAEAVFKTSKKKKWFSMQVVNLGSPHHGCYGTKNWCGFKEIPENDSAALQAWGCNISNTLHLLSSGSNPNNQESNEKQKKKVWELISNVNLSYLKMSNIWKYLMKIVLTIKDHMKFHTFSPLLSNVRPFIFTTVAQKFFNMALYSPSSNKNCWLTLPEISFN